MQQMLFGSLNPIPREEYDKVSIKVTTNFTGQQCWNFFFLVLDFVLYSRSGFSFSRLPQVFEILAFIVFTEIPYYIQCKND